MDENETMIHYYEKLLNEAIDEGNEAKFGIFVGKLQTLKQIDRDELNLMMTQMDLNVARNLSINLNEYIKNGDYEKIQDCI